MGTKPHPFFFVYKVDTRFAAGGWFLISSYECGEGKAKFLSRFHIARQEPRPPYDLESEPRGYPLWGPVR